MSRTIVMIHGMWGGGWCWEYYKNFFEEKGYQCHTPYLRYHEVDPQDDPDPRLGATSLLDYAQDLEDYIQKLDQKPILMGHSMGGLLAQMLGARDIATALVLLTPASPAGIIALRYSVLKSFWGILSKPGFWKNPHRMQYESAVYSMMEVLEEPERKSIYDRFVYESGRALTEIAFWNLGVRGASVDSAKVNCPVLVVGGGKDRITPPTVVRKVAQKYKGTYIEFGDHAHMVIVEKGWEKIAGFVDYWLEEKIE